MEIRMDGRAALVTGGSLGIGKAVATRFAESGAKVVIAARRDDIVQETAKEISAATGAAVVGIAADVADAASCDRLAKQATEAFGQIDILVNNAGGSRTGAFEELTDEVWKSDLEIKLFGAIRLTRALIPAMRERRWGRVINVLNMGAKAPAGGGAPTAVSRAAGMSLTKILANEYAPHNVLVNAMLVGRIKSDQWVRRHAAQEGEETLEEFYARHGASLPLKRYGEAEEFANLACFLASDAGGYITGTAINVDGGLSPVP